MGLMSALMDPLPSRRKLDVIFLHFCLLFASHKSLGFSCLEFESKNTLNCILLLYRFQARERICFTIDKFHVEFDLCIFSCDRRSGRYLCMFRWFKRLTTCDKNFYDCYARIVARDWQNVEPSSFSSNLYNYWTGGCFHGNPRGYRILPNLWQLIKKKDNKNK